MIDQPQQQNCLLIKNPQIHPQNHTQHLSSQLYSQIDAGGHLVHPPINGNFCGYSLNQADLHTLNINTKLPVNANTNSYERVFRSEVNGQNQGAHQFWKKLRMIKKNYICTFCTSSNNIKNSSQYNSPISLVKNNLHKNQCIQYKDWIISTLHNKIHLKTSQQDEDLLSKSTEKQWECLNNSVNEEYYKQESNFGNGIKEKRYKNNKINMGQIRNRSASTKAVMDLKYYNIDTALNQLHSLIHYYRFIMYIPLTPSTKSETSPIKKSQYYHLIPQIFSIVQNYKNIKKALTYTTIKLQLIMQNNEKLQQQQKERRQQSNKISSKNSSKNKISNKSSKIKIMSKTNKKNDKNKNKSKKNNYNIYIRQQTFNTNFKNDRQEQQYPSISRIPSDTNLVQSSVYYESIMDSLDNIRVHKLQSRRQPAPVHLEQSLYARFAQPQSSQQSLLISNMSHNSQQSVKELISCLDKSPKINHMTMITINSCQKPNITLHPTMQIIYQSQKTTPHLPHNISCSNINEIQSISSNQVLNSNVRYRSPKRNFRINQTQNGSLYCGKSQSKLGDKSKKKKGKYKCSPKNIQLGQNKQEEVKIKDKYHEYFEKEQITRSNKNTKTTTKQNKNKGINKRASRGSLAKSLKNNKSHSQKNNQFHILPRTLSKQQLNNMNKIGCQGKVQNRNQSKRKMNKNNRIHKSCGSLEPHFKNYSHITSTKCVDRGKNFQELEKSKEKAKYRDNAVFFTQARAYSNDKSNNKLNNKGKNKKKKTKNNKNESQRSAQHQSNHPSNLKITQFKNIITKLKYKIKCSKVQFDSRTSENNRKSQTVMDIKQPKNDIMNIINTIKLKEQNKKRMDTIDVLQDNTQKQTPVKQKYQEKTDRVLNRKIVENSGQITKKQEQILDIYGDKDRDTQTDMKNKQKRYKNKQSKNKINKKCYKQKERHFQKLQQKQKQIQKQKQKQKQKMGKKKSKKQKNLESQSNKKTIPQNDRKSSIKIQNKKKTSEKVAISDKQLLKNRPSQKKSRQQVHQGISQQF